MQAKLGHRAIAALLRPGFVLDRYELIEPVGRGAMGEVWRVRHTFTGADCAIKLLHPDLASHEELARLFVQEAQVGARLNRHPNIVRVQDAGRDPATGVAFLIMELLEGETLEDWRGRDGPLPWSLMKLILDQLGDAVQTAHESGIVHRDLKPGNLFLANDHRGEPLLKILDFGIARVLEEGVVRTATQIGTPAYAAPEQLGPTFRRMALGQGVTIARDISGAADVWSLGLLAYDLLTGAEPGSFFGVETVSELPVKIALEPAPVPSDRAGPAAGRLPPGFDQWFARCVDRDARRRYPTFREAASTLADLLAQAEDPALSVRLAPMNGEVRDALVGEHPGDVEPEPSPPGEHLLGAEQGPLAADAGEAESVAVSPLEPVPSSAQSPKEMAPKGMAPKGMAPKGMAPMETPTMEIERRKARDTGRTIVSRNRQVKRSHGKLQATIGVLLGLALLLVLFTHPWKPTQSSLAVVVAGPNNKAIDAVEVSIEHGSGKVEKVCRASPCAVSGLVPGAYLFRVKAPGYDTPAPEGVRLEPGSNLVKRIELSPARRTAALQVTTRATGPLHFSIDGREQGLLPATVQNLAPGQHLLRVVDERSRYETYEQQVDLANGEVRDLSLALKLVRGLAHISLKQDVEGARAVLMSGKDRREIPDLPATLVLDLTKPNTLFAWKTGYRDFEQELTFTDDEPEKTFEIAMVKATRSESTKPGRTPGPTGVSAAASVAGLPSAAASQPGTILINSIPISDATVDGQHLGATPTRWNGPPGTHAILFIHPDHGRKVISVVVEPGGTAVAAVRFP